MFVPGDSDVVLFGYDFFHTRCYNIYIYIYILIYLWPKKEEHRSLQAGSYVWKLLGT